MYDTIIIGAGPAGVTAAIYAERAGLKTLILEKMFVGGQMINTPDIENYPGLMSISGPDISNKFRDHLSLFKNIELKTETVLEIEPEGSTKKVTTKKQTYEAKTIILATGASPRKLNIKGEAEFAGMGVSYCATCDGAMFRGKEVMVIGGGNTAIEEAIFLSRICSKVHLVHRRDEFRAVKSLVETLKAIENIEIHYDSIPEEIFGVERKQANGAFATQAAPGVNSISLKNVKTNEVKTISINCVFVAIGQIPSNSLAEGKVDMTESGYIQTDAHMQTNIPGVFAAGDGRENVLKQVITAAAEGAIAGQSAAIYISTL